MKLKSTLKSLRKKKTMDSITEFVKQNYQLICLLVGLLGVVVGFISVIYEVNARKRKKNNAEKADEDKTAE